MKTQSMVMRLDKLLNEYLNFLNLILSELKSQDWQIRKVNALC